MILADTSVWVDHFRRGNDLLSARLDDGVIAAHDFVVGELACGNLRQRAVVLKLLNELPLVQPAAHAEVLRLIDARTLMGRGIGWIDAHLLSSCLMEGVRLWTLDRRLAAIAATLGVAAG